MGKRTRVWTCACALVPAQGTILESLWLLLAILWAVLYYIWPAWACLGALLALISETERQNQVTTTPQTDEKCETVVKFKGSHVSVFERLGKSLEDNSGALQGKLGTLVG